MSVSSPTLALLERSEPFRQLETEARKREIPASLLGAPRTIRPQVAKALHKETGRPVVVVTTTEQNAKEYAALSGKGSAYLPDADLTLRNVEGKSRTEEMERLRVLKAADQTGIVYMSATAALQPVVPKKDLINQCQVLEVGSSHNMDELLAALSEAGYERAGAVYSKGEYALRGEILDIFPADEDSPVRITFFDDEIENLRYFEPETQKSVGKNFSSIVVPPAREVILSAVQKNKLAAYFAGQPGPVSGLARALSEETQVFGAPANVRSLLSVLYPRIGPLSYFRDPIVLYDGMEQVVLEANRIREEFETEYAGLEKEHAVLPSQKNALLPLNSILDGYEGSVLDLAGSPGTSELDLRIAASAGFAGKIPLLAQTVRRYQADGGRVFLFAGRKAAQLAAALADQELDIPVLTSVSGDERAAIVPERLPDGFEIRDRHTLVLGVNDIFGHYKKSVQPKKRRVTDDIFSDLKPGDIVVEETHGKGRYLGLTTMQSGDTVGEYMEIEYRGGDRLYISTSKIEGVEKYVGGEEGEVLLSKLGSSEWEKAKSRVRESTKKLAFDMMKLYADRFHGRGFAFSPDTVWQREFEDAFPYEETDGQKESSEEIKKDMEAPRPMDRLLLGDVGFGKTEVAMRAAFKAVMDGKQVAVLVPTTLLARQHLETFRKRFQDFAVRVEGITRFSKGEHKKTLADLAAGSVDIIIGTHRLLSADVKFKELGLLIVDEEQRFGVNHKEKIKTLREEVDVLTLSATPIPRTLEMSLTGIRDMSTIETPPAMKKEPYTYVTRYTEGLLHDAVTREMRRGGQVYVVCRQIQQMDKLIEDVKRAAPDARIGAAHGRMGEKEMEQVVSGFIDGDYDVLVCTTIIENGIDIPNVNTIVVYEADKFGLSQLYQLKGRVGRGDQKSYAYFTYNSEHGLKDAASKRLQAIREFTELGSGFKIAMRDLQIRGAGDLLGAEQSGHMSTVGYAMYCRMMNEAVREAKGEAQSEPVETTVELGVPALIPDSYVSSQPDRMDIYRLVARIRSIADAKEVLSELRDRYGKLPKEVDNLITAAVIRSYAARAGFESVIRKRGCVELRFAPDAEPDVDRLLELASDPKNRVILKPSDPPVVSYQTAGVPGKHFLETIAQLAKKELKTAATAAS